MLFDYAYSQSDIKIPRLDQGNMAKTIRGKRNVTKDITAVYSMPGNLSKLAEGVKEVLDEAEDVIYIKEQVAKLLWHDPTISEIKKKELTKGDNLPELFIAKCLLYGMSRNFLSTDSKTIDNKTFMLSDYILDHHLPKPNKVFCGREKELQEIHNGLMENSCLFLHGIGGIGKSELVKQYARRSKKQYWQHVIYLDFHEGLYSTIVDLDFVDDRAEMTEQELFEKHYRFFKSLGSDTLVILDNFDTAPEKEELFHDFLSLDFHLIATTRNLIDEVSCYLVEEISSIGALEEIFYAHAPQAEGNSDIVQEIIEEVYRHTLTVELAAKTLVAAALNPEELLAALRAEGVILANPNKVKVTKDSRTRKKPLAWHIQTLFGLQALLPEQQYFLQHMLLMPVRGIPKELFGRWLGVDDYNGVNELVEYGWIKEEESTGRIAIHPFLCEVIAGFDRPSIRKCSGFLAKMGQEYVAEVEEQIYYRDLLDLVRSVFKVIVVDDTSLAFDLLGQMLCYLESNMYYRTMAETLLLMESVIPMGDDHRVETVTYEVYQGIVTWGNDDWETAGVHFDRVITYLEPVDADTALLAAECYDKISYYYLFSGKLDKYQECAERIVTIKETYGYTDSVGYDYAKTNEWLATCMNNAGEEPIEIEDLLEDSPLTEFVKTAKESGRASIDYEELRSSFEKMEPEELLNGEMAAVFHEVKKDLINNSVEDQGEFSIPDVLEMILTATEKQLKGKQ